mgnify:CR=1 FL=1|jgi:hypothetical protein
MNIPEQVKNEARGLIEQYGGNLEYLGDVDGQKAWLLHLPDDVIIGFPFLYLYKDGEAVEITGPSAFDFIDLYAKDTDEGDVE